MTLPGLSTNPSAQELSDYFARRYRVTLMERVTGGRGFRNAVKEVRSAIDDNCHLSDALREEELAALALLDLRLQGRRRVRHLRRSSGCETTY